MKNILLFLAFLAALCHPVKASAQEKGASPIPHPQFPIPGTTRAVVIGISDYQNPAIPDLRFADKDAEAFANFLRSPAGGELTKDELRLLTNREATAAQFATALDWLMEESKEGDQAVIYFSGHGDVERKTLTQPGFLLCWDAPPQIYMAGGTFGLLYLQEVISTLSIQNKVRVIVVTDACRSGKLAGSTVGGPQITGANLAKQFANEIKILSCQPNEYSIEGEQWGGGRGAFSYHLVDAFYGMADGNADLSVTLSEVDRYLEDHVTPEVAPISQVPMVVGSKTERLTAVLAETLAALRENKKKQTPVFAGVETRGLEKEVLAAADSTVRQLYRAFKKAVQEKHFFSSADGSTCADELYNQLVDEPSIARLHGNMKRSYAAALQDDAQQVLNRFLYKPEREIEKWYSPTRVKKEYGAYPRHLERAAELLGTEHYMYPVLQGRKAFFEGLVFHLQKLRLPDSNLGMKAIEKFRESLRWQPDAPHTYFFMSDTYWFNIENRDSAYFYLQKSKDIAPTWTINYTLAAVFKILEEKI